MPAEGEPNHLLNQFTLRAATEDDLDDLTRIHVDGFTEEPAVDYCYPLRDQYPQDYWTWTRKEYASYLEQPQKYFVHVIEAPSNSDSKAAAKPAGLAVWNLAVLVQSNDPDQGYKERRDANKKHCEAFIATTGKRFTTFFAEYAQEQINLSALVVHPDFRRHGAGTMLVNWGIEAAEAKGWPVTLCASPMGQFLYAHLRFEKIATEIVRAEGEEETLASAVMVRKYKVVVWKR